MLYFDSLESACILSCNDDSVLEMTLCTDCALLTAAVVALAIACEPSWLELEG